MLLQADAKALEWVCATYLSQDQTAAKEIWDGTDQHTDNQLRFGLPSRLIAKTFVFRLIYGGSAYSYANDTNFTDVSRSESFWQNVIDEFYNKYQGLGQWHKDIVAKIAGPEATELIELFCKLKRPSTLAEALKNDTKIVDTIDGHTVELTESQLNSLCAIEAANLREQNELKNWPAFEKYLKR